jgi:hypothetical protein
MTIVPVGQSFVFLVQAEQPSKRLGIRHELIELVLTQGQRPLVR